MVKSHTYIATPPGVTIKEQLVDRGISQKEFATRMGMSEKHISKLINGEVQLTPETAVRLEIVLGVPASFWNNLEAIYREKIIKAEAENAMDEDTSIAKKIPYKEMVDYGWIPDTDKLVERVNCLRRYFEVVELSILDKANLTRVGSRELSTKNKGDLALMTWAQEAKIQARQIETSRLNVKNLIATIPDIRKMTNLEPDVFLPVLKNKLADCGIALVFIPCLKDSQVKSATFLNGNKIVLAMVSGVKDIDDFWYSLFHEMAYIVMGYIGKHDDISEDEKKTADAWVLDSLILKKDYQLFCEEGDYSEQSVISFAKKIDIAPEIIVARMQLDGFLKKTKLTNLKRQYDIAV